MAASEEDNKKKAKKTLTVRERAEKAIAESSKPKKKEVKAETKEAEKKRGRLLKSRKEKLKDNKKKKRFHIVPKFIKEAFAEIKLVTWPDRFQTYKLTVAVILFATVFAIMVSLVDFGLGKIFKKVFLNG